MTRRASVKGDGLVGKSLAGLGFSGSFIADQFGEK
jgi:hypothetical protein